MPLSPNPNFNQCTHNQRPKMTAKCCVLFTFTGEVEHSFGGGGGSGPPGGGGQGLDSIFIPAQGGVPPKHLPPSLGESPQYLVICARGYFWAQIPWCMDRRCICAQICCVTDWTRGWCAHFRWCTDCKRGLGLQILRCEVVVCAHNIPALWTGERCYARKIPHRRTTMTRLGEHEPPFR